MVSKGGGSWPKQPTPAKATVIIVARPNQLWLSLQRLLRTVPAVEVLYQVADAATLLENPSALTPALLLLDFTTPDPALLTRLPQLRIRWPKARLIALTDGEVQGQQAEAAGIDVILPAGVLAAKLWETVATVLAEMGYTYSQPQEENR
ncbi:MAG: hypothetical protein U0350_14630 [Caldilineaceae bacterium]